MPEAGTVYLVGAGPGDPELLTLKGRECLARAEVVVYDSLVRPELLDLAPDGAERLYVGKQAGHHAMKQEDINALLAARAKRGQTVVRLKGGDPYVFGRGAEEAQALAREGLPFELIPGVTAGVAAPAYAGIPATHRDFNSALTFVTGHEAPDKEQSALDWKALAAGGGTLVIYMGVKNLPAIMSRLIEGGRSPGTPVAVIREGTLPSQCVLEGTLSDMGQRAADAGLEPPALVVVGEVVSLREQLRWFERLPLFSKTVVITRPKPQAGGLARRLQALGAGTIAFPTIRIEPPEDPAPLQQAIATLSEFDWIVFTSMNGVSRFFCALEAAGRDSRSLGGCKLCAIGSGTSRKLAAYGVRADLVPEKYSSNGLFAALSRQRELAGRRYLLPRSDIAPPDLPARLKEVGAVVTEVAVYKTLLATPDPSAFESLRRGEADIVTFTSSSTARNFATLVQAEIGALPDRVVCASIGPETSKAARGEGMVVAVEAEQHDLNGLVSALIEYFSGKKP